MSYSVTSDIPKSIFRAYDIRGIVGEMLTSDGVYTLGKAIASELQLRGGKQIIVGRDGRLSGPELSAALIQGLLDTGCDVIDIGQVPTPVLYFATHILSENSGVMLTGSHNPVNYNGLKTVLLGETLSSEAIQALYQRIIARDFCSGMGVLKKTNVTRRYIERVANDVKLSRPLKIVIDCGNGVAGAVAPPLFKRLGCHVIELFCEVDGNFPNHHPDPLVPKNLADLIKVVKRHQADIGLAFDGDADRLGMVTNEGKIIWSDRLLMLFATDLLSRHPGETIIYDVKCTRHLANVIRQQGGKPLMWKTGHSLLKAKAKQENALLAGEMSGHVFFKERWYGFDDGLYAGARLLEIVANQEKSAHELFAVLPDSVNTPELKIEMSEEKKFAFMEKLIRESNFENAHVSTIDGLRVDFEDGFALIRLSNTTPSLTLRFEGDNKETLERIKSLLREKIYAIDTSLVLPF